MKLGWIGAAIGAVCFIGGALVYHEMRVNYANDVDNTLDRVVYDKYGKQMLEAKSQLDICKGDAQKVYNSEIDATKAMVASNPEYVTAKTIAETNKSQIDILKRELKKAQEGNTTQVAVGSGNSAVAVSVKDTTAAAKIQSDISNLEKEMKVNAATRDRIWKEARKTVTELRSDGDKQIIAMANESEHAYNKVKFERELYKNTLKNDKYYMDEIRNEAVINNFSCGKVIISSVLMSIPMVLGLVVLWHWTIVFCSAYTKLKTGRLG